jgi:FAD/FMN-containing dehydrogenase
MGRSYGDMCLNPNGFLWDTRYLDNFIHFDGHTGVLECEAGTLLKDIQELVVPRGWMLPVTPGTQYVTAGGAIANDVHGKNHHRFGSFGEHVQQLTLVRSSGETIDCGPENRADWYGATVGGMGLTGVITRLQLKLRPVSGAWVEVETIPYGSLGEFFELADASQKDWEYTVSWIDCISRRSRRGIFVRGNHSPEGPSRVHASPRLNLPFTPPMSLVNRLSLRALNTAYFNLKKAGAGTKLEHYQPFFYPLDRILNWNRMYGPRGFYQYQCVVPQDQREQTVEMLLDETRRSNSGSFLAVLKTFGERLAPGMLSFPCSGVTLALDFPNQGHQTLALMDRMDAHVRAVGGRLYAAKDARMTKELYESGYPQLQNFHAFRDPGISSALSRRLLGS